ncbi:Nramp family divalent metal transporter [Sphingorhabdus sp. Alg239-R122]|uniref:Nramp family divalent metal transporter n=1 Tax=Sphingorhabdus sp. Alg239-R122 TaxID=2305989 RepID=UPI001F086C13|nr:Nramp family divalent metal transporter [Sphingorhabdus sp. Alg239-R122]
MSSMSKTGPGLIVAAAFIGPGTVTTATLAGANYGYTLLWALLFAIIATIILQYLAARIAILTQQGLAQAILGTLPHGITRIAMAVLVLAALAIGNAAYEAGNIGGGYLGLETMFPALAAHKNIAIAAMAAIIIALIALGGLKLLEKLLIALVLLMSLGFLASFFALRPDWSALFAGFVPSIPGGAELTAIALIGTTIVPYNLFLHAAMAKDRWKSGDDLHEMRRDTVTSISLGGLISLAIVATAAAALFRQGLVIKGGADMALQLEPLLGPWARQLIGMGLFAAGITSAITAPMATGFVVREIAVQFRPDLVENTHIFRWTAIAIVAIGAFSALSGMKLVELIVIAQAANGLLLPLVAILLFRLANNAELLGEKRNGTALNIACLIVIGVSLLLGFRLVARALGYW